jgi:hypothetical protein
MFNLEKKIDTEQKFANLVYKDFQTKRFGYLCDYQEQKEHDDALEPTPDLDITVVDCDAVVPVPDPTPPDDTPFPPPVELCRSIYLNGIDQRIFLDGAGDPYTNFNYNQTHSHSIWIKLPVPFVTQRGYRRDYVFYSRHTLTGTNAFGTGMVFGYVQNVDPFGNVTGFLVYGLYDNDPNNTLEKAVIVSLPTNTWLNLTVTSDGLTAAGTRFYTNGVEQTNVGGTRETLSSLITYNADADYEIGSITHRIAEVGAIYSEFLVHSLRSWDAILTPAEALVEYNNGFKTVPPVNNANCVTNVECNTSLWNLTNTEFDIDETQLPTTWSTDNAIQAITLEFDCPNGI